VYSGRVVCVCGVIGLLLILTSEKKAFLDTHTDFVVNEVKSQTIIEKLPESVFLLRHQLVIENKNCNWKL